MTPAESARRFAAGPVSVREWEGSGPPVLLAHGLAGNSHWWDPVIPCWSGGLRPAALEFRGHGDSERAADGVYAREAWIEDVECARRALGWERMLLCGHSMGARIALQYAARHPDRVRGVVAIDFLPEMGANRKNRFFRARNRPQPYCEDPERMVERFRLEPDGTALSPAELRELGRRCLRRDARGWTWKFDWRALGVPVEPIWEQLEGVTLPVLVLHGERSGIMDRAAAAAVAGRMPRSRAVEVPGAYHHVTLDAPRAVADAIAAFSAELAA